MTLNQTCNIAQLHVSPILYVIFSSTGHFFFPTVAFFPFVLLWLYCSGVLQYGFVVAKRKRRKTKQDKEKKMQIPKKKLLKDGNNGELLNLFQLISLGFCRRICRRIYICYLPTGRSVWWKAVTEGLKMLPEAAGRGQHFHARGHSF